MYAQLAFEAVTLAENIEQPPIATSARDLMRFVQVLLIAAAVAALCAVLFGLAVVADAAQARRTGSKPRISPKVDGRRIAVASAVGLVISLPGFVLLSILAS